ncbi:aspartate/glutamate racemase family protein [Kordiimonas lacus]|uniref:Aspartate racemase n=1 Tax=Kordiimonas lacus TaxID=637679 RepID=A0A1G7EIE3_9PROT|nr:amino acid racemase [Kordiimonas lacus]SDE63357.1 aspartate racemase [Kordiimonas lacus]
MKTIGLLGGMSWESTATYYRLLNESIKDALGGLHSAKILLHSVNFDEIAQMQREGAWDAAGEMLGNAAAGLEAAGADMTLICTNTMHLVEDAIRTRTSVPLLHIADATAEAALEHGYKTLALLGSSFTMEQDFYKGRIVEKFGIEVVIPDEADRTIIHDVIFDELCKGVISEASRAEYVRIIEALHKGGADAVILGCTEIGLLVKPGHTAVPLIDTTEVHCAAAVKAALA